MNEQQNGCDWTKPWELAHFRSKATGIPIQFSADLSLSHPVKIQSAYSMNNPAYISDKPALPSLFRVAAHADEPELKNALTQGRASLAEMMLNAERLEAILKAVSKKKKSTRRLPTGGTNDNGRMA